MSATRRRRLFAFAAIVIAAALVVWWMGRPGPHPELVASESTSGETPPTEDPSWLSLDLRWLLYRTTQVRFLVIDEQGLPLEGVRLSLRNHPGGVTDADGELVLDEVPEQNGWGEPIVEGPWLVVEGTTGGWIEGAFQDRLVVLQPSCSGVVRLVDEEGAPVVGATIGWFVGDVFSGHPDQPFLRTDGAGEVSYPDRPCGMVHFFIEHEASGYTPWVAAEVVANEPTMLTLPRVFQGVLAVVDGDQVPVDAKIESKRSLSVERLGVGRFSVRARRPWNQVELGVEGYPKQLVRMPLDGGEHVYSIIPGHEVEVTVLCDRNCPEDMLCDVVQCQKEGELRFSCNCPAREAQLGSTRGGWGFGKVQPEEDAVTLDLRENSSATGRWTGSLPCDVQARPSNHSPSGTCKPDGTFIVDNLLPGWTTVTVHHGSAERGAVYVELEAGESLDLGEIGPTQQIVDGKIDADFGLNGAFLWSTPHSRTELFPDGAFLLSGLPPETDEITLGLFSPLYGGFHETFPAPVQDSLPTWQISAREAVDTTPLDELLDAESDDTGGPSAPQADTGQSSQDATASPDTGASQPGWTR